MFSESSKTPGAGRHIFIAEDNDADLFLIRLALKKSNLDAAVQVSTDGEKAIRFLQNLENDPFTAEPDLILLDLHLPRRDGLEILRCIRSNRRTARTPVLLMTSIDIPAERTTWQTYEGVTLFRKPSTLTEFMSLGSLVDSCMAPPNADITYKVQSACAGAD